MVVDEQRMFGLSDARVDSTDSPAPAMFYSLCRTELEAIDSCRRLNTRQAEIMCLAQLTCVCAFRTSGMFSGSVQAEQIIALKPSYTSVESTERKCEPQTLKWQWACHTLLYITEPK